MFFTFEKNERKAIFLLTVSSVLSVNDMVDPLASNMNGFLKRETGLLPFS
jgi:hypothetical protein